MYELRIRGLELQCQQRALRDLLTTVATDRRELFGVLQLLEQIAQQAYDRYRIDAVLASASEAAAGYVSRQEFTADELKDLIAQLGVSDRNTLSRVLMLVATEKVESPGELRDKIDEVLSRRPKPPLPPPV